MHKKVVLGTFVLMLLLVNFPSIAMATTTLYVDPSMTVVTKMGDSFTVDITVSSVIDLAGWEFKLYYESFMLNATGITEGPFLKTGGPTCFMVVNFTDNHNATHGLIWATCAMTGAGPGVSGNGILARTSFKAKLPGVTILHLADTLLCNSELDPQPIPHVTTDGTVKVLIHSIAVVNVTPFKTIVGQGLTLKINVTVTNQGESVETFNIITYYNETSPIATQNVTLTNRSSTTIAFAWNTTGIAKGNYTISAYAAPVPGETDTADNTRIGGTVRVRIPGDVAPEFGIVDIGDIVYVAIHFGAQKGKPPLPGVQPYEANADINGDGIIDIGDIVIIAIHFGEKEV